MSIVTDGLVPGHSYTQWVVFFNHPERHGEDQWTMHDGGCHVGEDNICMMIQAAGAFGASPFSD